MSNKSSASLRSRNFLRRKLENLDDLGQAPSTKRKDLDEWRSTIGHEYLSNPPESPQPEIDDELPREQKDNVGAQGLSIEIAAKIETSKSSDLPKLFLEECVGKSMSFAAKEKIWNFFAQPEIACLLMRQVQMGTLPKSLKAAKKTIMKNFKISVLLNYAYRSKITGKIHYQNEKKFIKKKAFPARLFTPVYQTAFVKLTDIISIHTKRHNCGEIEDIIIGNDGVQETDSTSVSLNVFAIKFWKCDLVYPLLVTKTSPNEKPNYDRDLRLVIKMCREANVNVQKIVADAPKRAQLRKTSGHAGKFACDLCFAMAERWNSSGGPGRQVWPQSTLNKPPRTARHLYKIGRKLQHLRRHGKRSVPKSHFGVKGLSLLFHIMNFDPILDLLPDTMHFVYLGIVKRTFSLDFAVGNKTKLARSDRVSMDSLKERIREIKVPSEFARATREIDFANYKAVEWRDLLMFYFFIIVDQFVSTKRKRPWLLLAFLMRAFSLPKEEYDQLNPEFLDSLIKEFYSTYEKTYGKGNMTYNLHLMSHLNVIRKQGPLHVTSAFPFEGVFPKFRRCYRKGSFNTPKQIFENYLLDIVLMKGHTCQKKMRLKVKETDNLCDSLTYRFDAATGEYVFWKILKSLGEGNYEARRINAQFVTDQHSSKLPWELVGAYEYCSLSRQTCIIQDIKLSGKAIRVENYIIAIPNSILFEGSG